MCGIMRGVSLIARSACESRPRVIMLAAPPPSSMTDSFTGHLQREYYEATPDGSTTAELMLQTSLTLPFSRPQQ